jgi:hypothetical protein
MVISGTCIQWLLHPRRIAALVAFCSSCFCLFLLCLSSRINFRAEADPDLPVFNVAIIGIATGLSIAVHSVDACCDCLLQESKARAQYARKVTSVAGSSVSIALLVLPNSCALFPVIFFACFIALLGFTVSICWWFLPANAETTFEAMKEKSAAKFLSPSCIGIVVFAALISDNADQVLDAVTNIQIDSFVSGGKVKYVPCRFLEYVHFDR